MKGLGIALVGILAVAGGIAAATIITKKKLEKENDEDYYDDWDEEWDDDGADFDFDEDEDITDIEEEPDDAPVEDRRKKLPRPARSSDQVTAFKLHTCAVVRRHCRILLSGGIL